MSYKLLTNLLFEPRGKHNPSLTYNIKDTVMSEDGSKVYFALDNVPAGIPLTDTNYWMLQMDLSASKNAMDVAAANARTQTDATIASANTRVEDMMGKAAEAVTSVADYAAKLGMRVKGETKITKGNPMTIYPDGGSLMKVQTDIPIKQLGSGYPYPAGCGRNLMPNTTPGTVLEQGVTFKMNEDGTVYVTGTNTNSDLFLYGAVLWNTTLKPGTYTFSGIDSNAQDKFFIQLVRISDGEPFVYISAANPTVTFTLTQETQIKMRCYVYKGSSNIDSVIKPMLEAGSTASEYQPYSNIRPFVGYDELELRHAGKNLCDISPFLSAWATENTATLSLINKLSPGTYTISVVFEIQNPERASATNKYGLFLYPYGERVFAEWGSVAVGTTRRMTYTFNVTADNAGKFTAAYFYGCGEDGIGYTGYATTKNVQIEFGSTATPYEPYKCSIHTVQLGKTTYQGHYDWLTGKFRAEWVTRSFDGTNDNWRVTQYNNLCAWVDVPELVWSSTFYSSHFKCYNSITGESDGTIGMAIEGATSVSFGLFFGIKGIASTVDEWNAYLAAQKAAGTPLQVAYKLATPIETQLAPNMITAVEDGGVNYIYGDADLTVEWVKPLETSLTEHSNAKVDANNEALLMDVAQKERSIGNPVMISDAVANVAFPHVETVFMPKQAGSGDPYPAGGGKNLCNPDEFTQGDLSEGRYLTNSVETNNVSGYVPVSPNTTYTRSSNCVPGSREIAFFDADKNYLSRAFGDTFTTPDGCYFVRLEWEATYPLAECWFQLELGSVATEYAPYSNIRPITGWDKLNLTAAGRNLLPQDPIEDGVYGGVTLTRNPDGSIYVRGTCTEERVIPIWGNGYDRAIDIDDCWVSSGPGYGLKIIKADGSEAYYSSDSIHLAPGDSIVWVYFHFHPGEVWDGLVEPQIELGKQRISYEPYQGKTHTVQIGETVYGGRYNWLTGKLVAEWSSVALRDLTMSYKGGDHKYFEINMPTDALATADFLCESYKNVGVLYYSAMPSTPTGCMGYYSQDRVWRLKDTHYTSINELFTGNGDMKIAYKLSNPIEIQLDPTRITTIPGTNTIFGDGEFTIDWFKSYKKVAEERENLLLDSFTDKAELSGNPIAISPVGGLPFDSVVTEFAPKQAGSGDPYPAGGGKNLLNPDEIENVYNVSISNGVVTQVAADSAADVRIKVQYYTANGNYISQEGKTALVSSIGRTSLPLNKTQEVAHVRFGVNGVAMDTMCKIPVGNLTDGTYTISVNFTNITQGSISWKDIQIEAGSTATSYAPYSNIRPIAGYDKMGLNHAGKNLIDTRGLIERTHRGVTFTPVYDDAGNLQYINANGTATDGNADYYCTGVQGYKSVLPVGETVTISGADVMNGLGLVDLQSADYDTVNVADYGSGRTVVLSYDGPYGIYIIIKKGSTVNNVKIRPQIELGSTVSPYQPYQGTLHTVQIGQTVYGGKLDWLTGKFRAEWARVGFVFDSNFLPWAANNGSTDTLFYLPTSFYNDIPTAKMGGRCICSHAKTVDEPPVNQIGCQVSAGTDIGVIYLNLGVQTGAYGFNQYVAENGVQIAYELAEPYIIQLTPSEIVALTGVNTLYGDGNTITAKFRQSKDVDILKRLSALETLMINQTKGE